MYARAKIAGHPVHPALVVFPIAFYVGTLAALIAFEAAADPFWFHVAAWTGLAAVVTAAIAAVPGALDLVSIPAHTRARQIAVTHALLHAATLLLFLIATIALWRQWRALPAAILHGETALVLSAIGLLTMIVGGALGWTLVQSHHIGVLDALPPGPPPHTTSRGFSSPLAPAPHARTH